MIFFGQKFWLKVIFFQSMKDAGIFLGHEKNSGMFLGRKKKHFLPRLRDFLGAKKVMI